MQLNRFAGSFIASLALARRLRKTSSDVGRYNSLTNPRYTEGPSVNRIDTPSPFTEEHLSDQSLFNDRVGGRHVFAPYHPLTFPFSFTFCIDAGRPAFEKRSFRLQ